MQNNMTNFLLKTGQISILAALIGTGGVILASAITSWATSNNRISGIEKSVSVVEERESNHYSELQRRLEMMDKKLDTLLQRRLDNFK